MTKLASQQNLMFNLHNRDFILYTDTFKVKIGVTHRGTTKLTVIIGVLQKNEVQLYPSCIRKKRISRINQGNK